MVLSKNKIKASVSISVVFQSDVLATLVRHAVLELNEIRQNVPKEEVLLCS